MRRFFISAILTGLLLWGIGGCKGESPKGGVGGGGNNGGGGSEGGGTKFQAKELPRPGVGGGKAVQDKKPNVQ